MNLKNQNLLQTTSFINGQFHRSAIGTFEVFNPFTRQKIADVYNCDAQDTNVAIEGAHEAFLKWRLTSAGERCLLLRRWNDLILENLEDLAVILTNEQGKPINESRAEIRYGASFIEWFAEEAKRAYGDVIPGHPSSRRILVIKQPMGVVGAITPWNFPNAMVTRKIAPALAAGNTVVLKPAKNTPLSALALAYLALEAGIPEGVLQVLPSDSASVVGQVLTTHTLVRKISFTGSTAVGKELIRQCASTVKRVSMELGGNAPFIVLEDADLDQAVQGAMDAKFRNAGQTCVCVNRFFVQEGIYEEFTAKFTEAVRKLKTGNGLDPDVNIGPLVEEKAACFVEDLVKDALEKGANLIAGGKRMGEDRHSLLYEPTVLSKVVPGMRVAKEEIFGPVAPVISFSTMEEVISMANATPYGLAAYFYGRDHSMIWRTAEALEYGMVGINTGLISTTVAPFGGIKESGYGREGSKYGLDDYLQLKYLNWAL